MSIRPSFVPESLSELGFEGHIIGGVEVIIPPLCSVPAGSFLMGSVKARELAEEDETPQHQVDLAFFEIGKYPVTVAEFACALQAQAIHPWMNFEMEPKWKPQLRRLDHPVVNISWKDAMAFAAWLSELTGEHWRLPTEAEWEKAARGSDGRIYPWGDQWDATRANVWESGPGVTTFVGMYTDGASPYGVLDMIGNIWEFCSSVEEPYPYQHDDGREDPQKRGRRATRGGAWSKTLLKHPHHAASRYSLEFYDHSDNVGFRLVRG